MIDFLKFKRVGVVFFVSLCALFTSLYLYKQQTRGYAFTYSIDFTGGTQVIVRLSEPSTTEKVVTALEHTGFAQATVRAFSEYDFLIRVKEFDSNVTATAEHMKEELEKELPGVTVSIQQTESVGAGIGAAMWWFCLQAIVISFFLMSAYILWRFRSLGFSLGALGALLHDALVIMTFCLLFDYEISTNIVVAILMILGYSINDTIIIFARIRENMASMRGVPLSDIVNISINETLRRTLLTTFSTLLVVISLVLFGGEVLHSLAVALLVGFIFGTYSSIYVASPIMLLFSDMKQL
jgi:preprotein translocase subunit SecF